VADETFVLFTEDEIRVCTQIVGNLDQNGYLCATVPEIGHLEKLSAKNR